MSVVDEIKAKLDIVELISEAGVKLRRSGRSYIGFCPFHDNRRTPAFVVWPETGTWRCFGACNEGGDIIRFVMKKEGLDFHEALQRLATRAGVTLEPWERQAPEQREAQERLRKLLEEAVIFYHGHLLNHPQVLDYLRHQRHLSDTTIEAFGLGYAPDRWDAALTHFLARGYSEQDLLDAGLIVAREASSAHGQFYDRFRHRILFPIRDEQGRMAGFGGRVVDPNAVPKFLNSPETPLFSKGRLLYGLDRARKAIRAADQVVIVEGYLDVIALHQAGFENVVSPMGTALTEEQLRLLKKYTRRIVLALDPDRAGQQAILRGLEAARSAMDQEMEVGFDARGWLRQEARLQADLRVARLPEGLDPDEVVARDPEEWKQIVENARPVVMHVMETLAVGQDLNDPRVKSQIVAQVLPLIEDLPSPVERDAYRQALARLLRVDERALSGAPGPGSRAKRPRSAQAGEAVPSSQSPPVAVTRSVRQVEGIVLSILFHQPELLFRLDRSLQEVGLMPLTPADFEYTDHQLLMDALRRSLEQVEREHLSYVLEQIPESLHGLVSDLRARSLAMTTSDQRLLDETLRSVIRLRRSHLEESVTQLRFLQEEAYQQGDSQIQTYQTLALEYARALREVDKAYRQLSLRRHF